VASKKNLSEFRADIDAIDAKLLALVSQRARVAKRIGETKNRGARSVLDVAREKEVLRRVRGHNPGPLATEAIDAIFREIISACRASQEPISVAYLGPEGTFSHAAAIKQFGHGAVLVPVATIDDVFSSVETGRARYGVVPIENTTEGAVTPTLDALARTPLRVTAEVVVKIEHYLLSKSGRANRVKRIVSLPQPLAQCRRTLAEKFPGVPLEPAASTAAAARIAATDGSAAAVAGELAAKIYRLRTVAAHVHDQPGNVTRFLVIGSDPQASGTGDDRTSLVISVRDEVGVLGRILQPFTEHKVNLSMIESRPLPGRPWEYRFFVDVAGHIDDAQLARALADIDRISISTKVLGSYPVAE
jgi:chorismate mutase / prephenate dehydratase